MSGIPSWAVKGAKVVCINSRPPWWCGVGDPVLVPVEGEVYEISALGDFGGQCGLLLVGMGELDFWHCRRFRPLVTRSQEQDIAEHFAHHLRTPERVA